VHGIRRLGAGDIAAARALNALFGEAFAEPETYGADWPDDDWLDAILARAGVIVLVAEAERSVIGGLVAYLLPKLELRRSEIYVYDLAVAGTHRRQGVATALLKALGPIAAKAGAHAVFVQADREDAPAIALYDALGRREEVLHFDLALPATAHEEASE
jgi:aminoglycoside 3-N-acetyltransferase I